MRFRGFNFLTAPCASLNFGAVIVILVVTLALTLTFVTSAVEASAASVRKTKMGELNTDHRRLVNKRDDDHKSPSSSDIGNKSENVLMSGKMDAQVMSKLGNAGLAKNGKPDDRKRRDHDGALNVALKHIQKSEANAEAAAEESSRAETHSVAAAEASAEAGLANLEQSALFEENDEGQMVAVQGNDVTENESKNRQRGPPGYLRQGSGPASDNEAFEKPKGPQRDHQQELLKDQEMSPGSFIQGGFGLARQTTPADGSQGHQAEVDSDTREHSKVKIGVDVETPLDKLIEQSTDLGKETRLVFQVIAQREETLIREMEDFKIALQSAIEILRETEQENSARIKRWDSGNIEPYRACVYVTPPDQAQEGEAKEPRRLNIPPPTEEPEPAPIPNLNAAAAAAGLTLNIPPALNKSIKSPIAQFGEDIDLSSVYWLKLAKVENATTLDKVQNVLTKVRQRGRDLLIIPVHKGFTTPNDVANGFLRAVSLGRSRSASDQSLKGGQRRRRRKLRLRIRRVL